MADFVIIFSRGATRTHFGPQAFVIQRRPTRSIALWPVNCCLPQLYDVDGPSHHVTSMASPRIGLALGGGFARGIAHAGVLRILERHGIPIHCITGVSAGSIVAAAFASGAQPDELVRAGRSMRFSDVARWSLSRMGFVVSERMKPFLRGLLKHHRFEDMRIPLGVVATDLCTGEPVSFRDTGDVFLPIRASCSYPGLFQPVRLGDRVLVDGAMSTEIPALLARELGATHVVSIHLPAPPSQRPPADVFQVIRRCFQIMQIRNEDGWRQASDLVITPAIQTIEWDGFERGPELVKAGEAATLAALPAIESWFAGVPCRFSEETELGFSKLSPTAYTPPQPA
jgi:NTE family protein